MIPKKHHAQLQVYLETEADIDVSVCCTCPYLDKPSWTINLLIRPRMAHQ